METTIAVERATHVRIVAMENISHRDRRSQHDAVEIDCLVDVAIELDSAAELNTDKHGGSGIGAGAYLEALIVDDDDDPDDADGETVDSIDDALFVGLPTGDVSRLRRFIQQQKNSTCWNGNNHVEAPHYHSEGLLRRIRGRS